MRRTARPQTPGDAKWERTGGAGQTSSTRGVRSIMTTTDISTSVPYREVTDRNGRVYRLGETDRDIMRRPRWTMVLL
ncbi:MFS transporter, partial [Streptomyces sp. NPDC002738]